MVRIGCPAFNLVQKRNLWWVGWGDGGWDSPVIEAGISEVVYPPHSVGLGLGGLLLLSIWRPYISLAFYSPHRNVSPMMIEFYFLSLLLTFVSTESGNMPGKIINGPWLFLENEWKSKPLYNPLLWSAHWSHPKALQFLSVFLSSKRAITYLKRLSPSRPLYNKHLLFRNVSHAAWIWFLFWSFLYLLMCFIGTDPDLNKDLTRPAHSREIGECVHQI